MAGFPCFRQVRSFRPIFRGVAALAGLLCGLAAPALAQLQPPALAQLQPPALAQLQPIVPGPTRPVELELVLAVDTSSSVSPEEFELQMRGFAAAFRDPSVLAAIAATGEGGIAVTMFQWSDNRRQAIAVDWRHLAGEDAVLAFADEIDRTPRFLDGGGTAIGGAIEYGLSELDRNAYEGRRRVIDISGDGRANQGAQPDTLRDLAVLSGVTVNGLAILNEDTSVASYYTDNVIGGQGAFVMTANDYESFAQAILEKLIKEIGGVPVVEGPREDPHEDPDRYQGRPQYGQGGRPGGGPWGGPLEGLGEVQQAQAPRPAAPAGNGPTGWGPAGGPPAPDLSPVPTAWDFHPR